MIQCGLTRSKALARSESSLKLLPGILSPHNGNYNNYIINREPALNFKNGESIIYDIWLASWGGGKLSNIYSIWLDFFEYWYGSPGPHNIEIYHFNRKYVHPPWAPKTMNNKGFGHLKTRLYTIKTSKHVGFGVPWSHGVQWWDVLNCYCLYFSLGK